MNSNFHMNQKHRQYQFILSNIFCLSFQSKLIFSLLCKYSSSAAHAIQKKTLPNSFTDILLILHNIFFFLLFHLLIHDLFNLFLFQIQVILAEWLLVQQVSQTYNVDEWGMVTTVAVACCSNHEVIDSQFGLLVSCNHVITFSTFTAGFPKTKSMKKLGRGCKWWRIDLTMALGTPRTAGICQHGPMMSLFATALLSDSVPSPNYSLLTRDTCNRVVARWSHKC